MNRRDLLKSMAAGAAVSAAEAMFPGVLFAPAGGGASTATAQTPPAEGSVAWRKTPCRFCGVGCGLLVGISNGRAVAVKGDPASPVNRGLCCVKGYHSVMALYGKDRLTRALVRKDGKLVPVPMKEALDLVASKMAETIKAHGKDAVAIYGSGQWTIPDGYVASKFMKGAIGTNNLEANARLCMSSAVTGFMTSFGLDEPMGCYDDIDHADTFVLWGNNMAEMHPVLFSRLLERRLKNPDVKIIDLATRWTRTSMAADRSILFKPQTDLAIANAICHEIIRNDWVNTGFVRDHVSFHEGKTNIGYGLEDKFAFKDEPKTITLERYRELLADYSVEKVEPLSGVPARELRYLASLYADPKRKVMSFWCMGFNQHTRGTWINNLVYNIHLLVGKIATPGNSPFSLTGQPSACGTVREVGTLTNRLPHGEVTDEKSRKMAAEIWGVPLERISAKPTYHTMEMFRALDRGDIRFIWIQVTNPMVTLPKLRRYRDGAQEGRPLRRGLRRLPHADHGRGRRGAAGGDVDRARGHVRQLRAAHAALREDADAARRGHERHLADDRGGAAHGLREALPLERGHPHPGDLEGVLALPARAGPRDGALRGAAEAPGRHVALRERERDQVAVQRPVRSGGQGRLRLLRQARPPRLDLVPALRGRRRRCRTRSTRSGSTPGACSSTGTRDL